MMKKFKFINLMPLALAATATIAIIIACGKGTPYDIDDRETQADVKNAKGNIKDKLTYDQEFMEWLMSSVVRSSSSSKPVSSSSSDKTPDVSSSGANASASGSSSSNPNPQNSSSSGTTKPSSSSGEPLYKLTCKVRVNLDTGTVDKTVPDKNRPKVECTEIKSDIVTEIKGYIEWTNAPGGRNGNGWNNTIKGEYSKIEAKANNIDDDTMECQGLTAKCDGTFYICDDPTKSLCRSSSATSSSSVAAISSSSLANSSSAGGTSSNSVATYTVTYNANGGTGGPTTQTKTQGTALTLTTDKPTRTGYTFASWNTVQGGTGTSYNSGGSYTADANVTLYAQWTANAATTYTVTYNANGGTGGPTTQTKTQGTALTLTTDKPTRTGYTFASWNTVQGGTGTSYNSGGSYTADANVTLYAQWTANAPTTYTVTYNANGGTGGPTTQTKTQGTALTLTTDKPTRAGYTFASWNTVQGGTGTSYNSGGSYTADANVTLYAQWTQNAPTTYTVTYNANGGTGAPANQTKTQGTALTLTTDKPTRTGFTFDKWNTAANGSGTSYASGASYTTDAALTLYAQWTAASACEYVQADCGDIAKGNVITAAQNVTNGTAGGKCYFATSATEILSGENDKIKINGQAVSGSGCSNSGQWGKSSCSTLLAGIAKRDEGYYIYFGGYTNYLTTANTYNDLHPNCK